MKKQMKPWKRILLTTCICFFALIFLAGVLLLIFWHDEVATVASIELVRERNDRHYDGAVYTMHVSGGFYLDDFLEQGGVKSDAELIDFLSDKITKGLFDLELEAPEIGCASFTAQTESGDALFARNYDLSKTNVCIVFTEANEGRHASISTVDLQFLGIDPNQNIQGLEEKIICLAAPYVPLDGMNDAGVSCGIYMTYQGGNRTVATDQNTRKPDVTSSTLLRLILDYADNVEEAVKIAESYDLHDSANTSYHYMVADASGKSAILEWVGATDSTDNHGEKRELKVTYNDDDSHIGYTEGAADYQVVTNFIIQPGYYGTSLYGRNGYDRYSRIYQELRKSKGIVENEVQAMEILGLVGRRNWDNDDKNTCTVHSVVYNLTDRTVLWVSNECFNDPGAIFRFRIE